MAEEFIVTLIESTLPSSSSSGDTPRRSERVNKRNPDAR